MENLKGFTLFEILIYIAISTIVMTAIVQIFFALNRSRGTVEARHEVESSMRFALEKIAGDVRASSSVIDPALPGATSPGLELIVSGTHVYYCVQGGVLRRESGAPCAAISPPVTGDKVTVDFLVFTRSENTNTVLSRTAVAITVDLTVSSNTASPDSRYTKTKRTTISLR